MRGHDIKIFFATDIHGSDRCFRKFVNAGKFYGADVLLMGGDITGKMLVPIVEDVGGRYRTRLFGRVRVADAAGIDALPLPTARTTQRAPRPHTAARPARWTHPARR